MLGQLCRSTQSRREKQTMGMRVRPEGLGSSHKSRGWGAIPGHTCQRGKSQGLPRLGGRARERARSEPVLSGSLCPELVLPRAKQLLGLGTGTRTALCPRFKVEGETMYLSFHAEASELILVTPLSRTSATGGKVLRQHRVCVCE